MVAFLIDVSLLLLSEALSGNASHELSPVVRRPFFRNKIKASHPP